MPTSGPVYQPTTVGYERQDDWARGGYLANMSPNHTRRFIGFALLFCGVALVGIGLCMMVVGSMYNHSLMDKTDSNLNGTVDSLLLNSTLNVSTDQVDEVSTSLGDSHEPGHYTELIVVGGLIMVVGILVLVGAVYLRGYYRWCFPGSEKAYKFSKQLQENQNMSVNHGIIESPSANNDSDIPSVITAPSKEAEECDKLMEGDKGEASLEDDMEQMIGNDSRIVLRPLQT